MSFMRSAVPVIAGLALSLHFIAAVHGQQSLTIEQALNDFPGLKPPPACIDNRGMKVTFRRPNGAELSGRIPNFAASFRDPDVTGVPFVILDVPLLAQTPPEFQSLIYRHECAHHELGHLNRHRDKYSKAQKRELEYEADCEAGKNLAQREKYTSGDMSSLFEFMTEIGQWQRLPRQHTQHRINRIHACYQH